MTKVSLMKTGRLRLSGFPNPNPNPILVAADTTCDSPHIFFFRAISSGSYIKTKV